MSCDLLSNNGFCNRVNCTLIHGEACSICPKIRIIYEDELFAHALSKDHLRSAYSKGVVDPRHCSVCQVPISDSSVGFVNHYKDQTHIRNAETQGLSPLPFLLPAALRRCFPCNQLVQHGSWTAHVRGSAHLAKGAKQPDVQHPANLVQVVTKKTDLGNVEPNASPRQFRIDLDLPSAWRSATVKVCQLSKITLTPVTCPS